ncbi:unnamed protein product [Moneuplotes crassus]|uniref:Thioredoxin domain-containing protein n=1 Tax=Euplotes crassus TaxID=5936 RepID=A0AAD2D450_EUPCR|nr:unnamed protein product [Moneuplotes crassus]
MKLALVILLIVATAVLGENEQILTPSNSDQILDHLEGNNQNIYLLFFAASSPYEEVAHRNNKEIEDGLKSIITDNPEIYFARIEYGNPSFHKLAEVTQVNHAPSVFLMVHGQGVWIYEGTSELILERLKDFLPQFKQASSHKTAPYTLE